MSTLLLGFAAAAIAFGIHETSDWLPSIALLPVALGGVAWSVSFLSGIGWAHVQQNTMRANIALQEIDANHPRWPEAQTMWDSQSLKASRCYQAQLWGLFAGAILFVVGHGIHISEATPKLLGSAISTQPGTQAPKAKPILAPTPVASAALKGK